MRPFVIVVNEFSNSVSYVDKKLIHLRIIFLTNYKGIR
jgi:hypothetical protein